jgi:hypothetical protein
MHENSFDIRQTGGFGNQLYSEEQLLKNRDRLQKIHNLGIRWPSFGSGKDMYTADERTALYLLNTGKEVPQDLANRIIQYHKNNPVEQKPVIKDIPPELMQEVINRRKTVEKSSM